MGNSILISSKSREKSSPSDSLPGLEDLTSAFQNLSCAACVRYTQKGRKDMNHRPIFRDTPMIPFQVKHEGTGIFHIPHAIILRRMTQGVVLDTCQRTRCTYLTAATGYSGLDSQSIKNRMLCCKGHLCHVLFKSRHYWMVMHLITESNSVYFLDTLPA